MILIAILTLSKFVKFGEKEKAMGKEELFIDGKKGGAPDPTRQLEDSH